MKEWLEKQIIQSVEFIARDRTISNSERAKAYEDVLRFVKEAADILGETDIQGWMKRMGIEQEPK